MMVLFKCSLKKGVWREKNGENNCMYSKCALIRIIVAQNCVVFNSCEAWT